MNETTCGDLRAWGWLYNGKWFSVELPWSEAEEREASSLRALLEAKGWKNVLTTGMVTGVKTLMFENPTPPAPGSVYVALTTIGLSDRSHVVMLSDLPALFAYLSEAHNHGNFSATFRW